MATPPNVTETSTPTCGATTRAGTPCKYEAGYKTPHKGSGRCHLHGGLSTGPPFGNKNALVTGEYETLHVSALSPPEQTLYNTVTTDQIEQHKAAIKLASVREHRILLRIQRYTDFELDSEDGFSPTSHSETKGWEQKGKVDTTTIERAPIVETIMRLESALDRIQTFKARIVEYLRLALMQHGEDTDGLDAIVRALDRSASRIAQAKENEST